MYGWLDLVGNDELDGRGFERVLWIEPNHEVKNLILEKVSKKKKSEYQTQGVRGRGAGGWAGSIAQFKTTSSSEKTAPCTNFPQEPLSKKTMS